MIVTYRTAEVVAFLRDLADTLTGDELESGAADDRLLRAVVERFPLIGPAQMAEVVQAYEHEVDADESEVEEQEASDRRGIAFFQDLCRRNGLGGDPTMLVGEALRIMAWSGDADAAQLLATSMEPQARAERNILVAAYDAHPAWTSDGIAWVQDEAVPGPQSDADLIDWYQRTHPREAAAMEAAAARPVVPFQARGGRARLKMHGAWRVALNRVVTIEEAPPITLAWMLSAEMQHHGTDIVPVERVMKVFSSIYPRPIILSGLYRLEDLGAIIITPEGVHLSSSIVQEENSK